MIGGVNLYVYVGQNPVTHADPFGLINPAKAAIGAANVARASLKFTKGILKIGAATGLVIADGPVPLGDVAPVPVAISAGVNFGQGYFLARRGFEQFFTALDEPFSAQSARNLLGLLPFGQNFDDVCEPTPLEFLETKYNRGIESTKDFLETVGEILTFF